MEAEDWEALRDAAHDAASRCYAPYSGLAVGAAVRASDGTTHTGANVENRAYGLALCAERVAIAAAVQRRPPQSDPALALDAVVAVDGEGRILSPCGACRQVILEFGKHAHLWLPHGRQSIDNALADPFELPSATKQNTAAARATSRDRPANWRIVHLLAKSRDDKVLLLRQIMSLRQRVCDMYPEIGYDETRAILFSLVGDALEVAPGFFSNFDQNVEERMLHIPIKYGISGGAYAIGEPNFGVPCTPGALAGHELPAAEQAKVDPHLRWVVSWPLQCGVVSLDGYGDVGTKRMADIASAPELRQIVSIIDKVTQGD